MAPHPDYPRTRLFVEQPLAAGLSITLEEKQAHYLSHVLRFKEGDKVALFNGSAGEWLAVIDSVGKKTINLAVEKQLRPQKNVPDLWLVSCPLKGGKTEFIVEKATELGIARYCPVSTQFTIVDKVNEARLRAIAIEASEQCERMDIPAIDPLTALERLLGNWPKERRLIYGDESGKSPNATELLPALDQESLAVLVGPEGGFSVSELALLRSLPYVTGMCMGPRVMRADTAAIALLALVQAASGDWNDKPAFRNH